jgi:hypothetical protein
MSHQFRTAVADGPLVDDELLTIAEAAAILRTPVATLRYWRHIGTGPHSFRVGRNVRYWRTELISWLEQQSSDPQAAH